MKKQYCDWLTNDDDEDSSYYLESQGEGDEGKDCNIVPEEERRLCNMY